MNIFNKDLKTEFENLMKKYNLTIKDLPAFPPKNIDLKELIKTIGEAKRTAKKLDEYGKR